MIFPQGGASFTPTRVVVEPTLTHLRPNEAMNLTADAAESACALRALAQCCDSAAGYCER